MSRTGRRIMKIVGGVALITLLAVGILAAYLFYNTPSVEYLSARNIPQTTIIYDRSGEHQLYQIHGEENRKILTHQEISEVVRIATIAAEDGDFYSHFGVDPISILRAVRTNFKNGNRQQGASTITQQLARSVFLSREKTLKRKLLEAVLAIKIERRYSKQQILDMYLNQVPYGSNAYGIETAAETFFGKSARDLTLDEAAFLAALPKAPTYYSPYGTHRQELVDRYKSILNQIENLGLASQEKIEEIKKIAIYKKIRLNVEPIDAPHFVFYVRDELIRRYGQKAMEEGGLRVYTSLDYDLQTTANQMIQERVAINTPKYKATNAALVSIDPKNGQILAMVGSKDFFDAKSDGEVNVATRLRQPGSSFKPFAYATAFEKGYQPETLVIDAPTNFGPDGSGRPYIPRNYDGKSHGVVTMREALAMSLNIPAVKTLQAVGIDDTIAMAHRLGVTSLNDRKRYGLSLVIGGGEVTLLDETASYSVFANDGKRNPIDPFLKITDTKGQIFYENQSVNNPVLDPQVARKINSILSDNTARSKIFGPNNLLHLEDKVVAAKTGTTQEWRDAWTVGYTPTIAVGVWAGNNNNAPMRAGADGSFVAAPIWNKFISYALNHRPTESFVAYDSAPKPENKFNIADYKIVYFDKKKGKEISEKKMKKLEPSQVETRFIYIGKTISDNSSPTTGKLILPNKPTTTSILSKTKS